MTLTTRLTAFFLIALAVVLALFSVTTWCLARSYLYRAADERLDLALAALGSAAEQEVRGIEWEPREHRFDSDRGLSGGGVSWAVYDRRGRVIDAFPRTNHDFDVLQPGRANDLGPAETVVAQGGQRFRVLARRLQASPAPSGAGEPAEFDASPAFDEVTLVVAGSLEAVDRTLARLGGVMAVTSVGLWALALLGGRWMCRRALLPLARMTDQVQALGAADYSARLDVPPTKDEIGVLAAALNDMLARLRESYDRQRRFAADAAHQLRTPLTGMLGQMDVCLRHPRPTQEYERVIERVHGETQHLARIVEALLFLARSGAGEMLPNRQLVDLSNWLPGYAEHWGDRARGPDLRVENEVHSPLWVNVQPILLGQLLDNLVENAFHHSTPGSPVVLRLAVREGQAVLSVIDRGEGIAPADLPHVFEPFYRARDAVRPGTNGDVNGVGGDLSGVGLGLAVAHQIARSFSGQLTAESRPGAGSRFELRLPIAGNPPAVRDGAVPALTSS
ncbi:MAG: HAMP domain-containing protein [Planctomycetia bacterium]|nr:HAMP domain-containing protein [Planctomycetia bacterium]